jgi:Na+-transporting methylmalonyl-CoA/oxaloacetate decarboxylase gamma subunit
MICWFALQTGLQNMENEMSIEKQLENMRRQAVRYSFDDGLIEQILGGLFLLGAAAITVQGMINTPYATIVKVFLSILIMIASVVGLYIVKKVKEKMVYPRTGYVQPRETEQFPTVAVVIALALIFGTVVFTKLTLPGWVNGPALFQGMLMAALLAFMGYMSKLTRFYGYALIPLVISLLTGSVSRDVGMTLTIAGTGLVLLTAGLVAFRSYLHAHPEQE